ncbi:MAG: septum formation protein Maf [Firmicutes bacterium]|nr:septum formation protein Maf [Bacillota bacterium]
MRVILASGSPRRKELLKRIYDEFEVITAPVDERVIEERIEEELKGLPMYEVAGIMVSQLSKAKALAVFEELGCPDGCLVIGADTAVAVSDEIMGKPKDRDDAVRMLRKLSMEKQYVLTGVTVIEGGKLNTFVETSLVYFNPLDEEQERKIQEYCDTPEPYDKAGAYGIQLIGDEIVDHIEGDFDNIMGLPVERLKKELLCN